MGVTVRRAQLDDLPQLVELNAPVQDAHVAAEPSVFKPALARDVAAWFSARLDAESPLVWVAVDGARLIGYVTVQAEQREEHAFCRPKRWWEVDQLGVRPEWRRRGVARALLAAIAAAAVETGVGQLALSTWSFNSDAQEAWRRLGFAPQTTRFAVDPRRLMVAPTCARPPHGSHEAPVPATLRRGCMSDAAALKALDTMVLLDPQRAISIDRWLASDAVFVAAVDGEIVGYAVFNHDFFHRGNVDMLMVAAEYRGRRTGEQLLRALEQVCDAPKLFCTTNLSNHRMQRLLARCGYHSCGVVDELDPGDPELVYVKHLRESE